VAQAKEKYQVVSTTTVLRGLGAAALRLFFQIPRVVPVQQTLAVAVAVVATTR
jgi:hypothetical protein